MMQHIRGPLMAATVVAVMTFGIAGCGSDDPTSVDDSNVSTVPALSEIVAAVSLSTTQAGVIETALGDWRQAEANASPRRFAGRDGDFDPERRAERHRPMMDFVAMVAPSLDSGQLKDLAQFLVQHRERHRSRLGGETGERHGGFDDGRIAEELGLTVEQREAMTALRKETHDAAREIHQKFRNGNITKAELNQALVELHAKARQRLGEILTEEQLARFEEWRRERMKQRIERQLKHLGRRLEERVQWLTKVLGLTDDQSQQVTTVLETSIAERKTVLELLRDGDITREEVHTQMLDIREATMEALGQILTEEQAERLDAVRLLQPRGPRH
ncbi:MAG: hypothetical protein OEN01_01760 [Candidatus Krumholzibacteria bacterium]|nr:hypothetical protein [Candidatus Krumholzibacteria bacterium]